MNWQKLTGKFSTFPGTALILFGRVPEYGTGKTRLSAQIGKMAAFKLYELCLQMQIQNIQLAENNLQLYFDFTTDAADSEPDCRELQNKYFNDLNVKFRQQKGATLGERMRNSYATAFKKHEVVILQGVDLPCLLPEDLVSLIANCPSIVPAIDGGWMALSLHRKQFFPELFDNIPWSNPKTLHYTLQNLAEQNIYPARLERRPDLDTVDDLFHCGRWLFKHAGKLGQERISRGVYALSNIQDFEK